MRRVTLLVLALLALLPLRAVEHPSLLLTRQGVAQMRAARGTVPLFDASLDALLAQADEALSRPVELPEPRDGGGGASHEKHKLNYFDMYNCGVAWQLTGQERYAAKVREMLLAYADFYPALGYHPLVLSPVPGRIFWQTLNESVFLLRTAVAYDCVWDYLSRKDRKKLEEKFFRPYIDFVMNGTPDNRANQRTFNALNNHATWANSAVGMMAIVMGDDHLLQQALYGADLSGKAGFIPQLDELFSPDGYFTEGAYYQRYAIWPFVMFGQCLANARPDLDIFGYRDGIILKAVDALLQMAYNGEFFHFNDALEKGYDAQELISAVDIAYLANPADRQLLWVADHYQPRVEVTDAGFAVACGLRDGLAEPLQFRSCVMRDGADGSRGALAIIRSTRPGLNSAVTLKATQHGLSHGHFDRLTLAYYDHDAEILTDYGASRFLNIEAKYKGHYTRENKTYAKSTIAHNALVADCRSHFDGSMDASSACWPTCYADVFSDTLSLVSAVERNAYPDIVMSRYVAYADVPFLEYPLVMDLLKAESPTTHRYDYPVHYLGHMISLSEPYERSLTQMPVLGAGNGYQHFWVEARAAGGAGKTTYTWLQNFRMYSLSTATTPATQVFLARLGASDPDFNLRSEPMYLLREEGRSDHLFASCLETHGKYDIKIEQSENLEPSCTAIDVLADAPGGIVVRYGFKGGRSVTLCVWRTSADPSAVHTLAGRSWKGVVKVFYE